MRHARDQRCRRFGVRGGKKSHVVAAADEFLGEVAHDALCASVQRWRDALKQWRDLSDAHSVPFLIRCCRMVSFARCHSRQLELFAIAKTLQNRIASIASRSSKICSTTPSSTPAPAPAANRSARGQTFVGQKTGAHRDSELEARHADEDQVRAQSR